jgi:hypothetical protein
LIRIAGMIAATTDRNEICICSISHVSTHNDRGWICILTITIGASCTSGTNLLLIGLLSVLLEN